MPTPLSDGCRAYKVTATRPHGARSDSFRRTYGRISRRDESPRVSGEVEYMTSNSGCIVCFDLS